MDDHRSSLGYSLPIPMSTLRPRKSDNDTEPIEFIPPAGANRNEQIDRRRRNNQGIIENPLVHLNDEELLQDVLVFWQECLPTVDRDELIRAARVAQNARSYDEIARSTSPDPKTASNEDGYNPLVQLREEEKAALIAEKDSLFSEKNMFIVILTVSLAAFLQGFVQSSINGASLYPEQFHLNITTGPNTPPEADTYKLGAANASPFFFAALLGCWLSLPINDLVGRRGAMTIAAILILASSLGAAWCLDWKKLLLVRMVNGIGMGVKAVSTPILASETAVGFWRGSAILAWQLWVAFGIMMGFAFNLIFYTTGNSKLTVQLILGSPCVPAVFLLIGLYFCPESPRYYMRQRTSSYNPQKAYEILLKLRKTELQALRDVYLVYKSVQLEEYSDDIDDGPPKGLFGHLENYVSQYRQLFTQRRLRNAAISSSIVALSQQLCGINVLAFYSGTLFSGITGAAHNLSKTQTIRDPMLYSFGYGVVNFVCGLPAIKTIDTLGRRKWLVITLPVMTLLMLAAAMASLMPKEEKTQRIAAIACSQRFTHQDWALSHLPSHLKGDFPLSHREAGAAFAISINLLFAGFIQLFFPSIYAGLDDKGSLGLFAGLNFVAFILVFLFVEETKRRSLEDLDLIFAFRKRDFVRHQLTKYLPWFFRRYVLRRRERKPLLYRDLIWGAPRAEMGVDRDWNWEPTSATAAGGEGRGFGREESISPEFPRRPSGFTVPEHVGRVSEDSIDSAHR
ncbi:uncharacterized protein GGS22DRAFT_197936 [Annulohypoxylon maeteangense]|uniref:uncharacterized protein n=1 Tax=Annulohypoxylon maeteangense TaxID=1927788 RepID=UPI002008A03C|nr:uncharacterized protein GGS22DRAFT_197936 [Annulohypoxylon maeteangense]KAI0888075.1 hypothetical protein GGS22DRAFT_197936 [Annulohypoxylon maeteangense]